MADVNVEFSVGVVKWRPPPEFWQSVWRRFSSNPLIAGPCLIIDRHSGLALDAGPDPYNGTRPVTWTTHAAPWQQWRIKEAGDGTYRIISEFRPLALTTDHQPGNKSWVWMDPVNKHDTRQLWRLTPTDDRAAYLIETKASAHALDAKEQPLNIEDPTKVHIWGTHKRACQQWMICRLPLT